MGLMGLVQERVVNVREVLIEIFMLICFLNYIDDIVVELLDCIEKEDYVFKQLKRVI